MFRGGIHAAWVSIIGPGPTQPRLTRKGKGEKEKKKEREEKKRLAANIGTLGLAKIICLWLPQITQQCGGEQPIEIG